MFGILTKSGEGYSLAYLQQKETFCYHPPVLFYKHKEWHCGWEEWDGTKVISIPFRRELVLATGSQ